MTTLHLVGPLRVGPVDVEIRTNSAEFAAVAGAVFADLGSRSSRPSVGTVVFETIEHHEPQLHWSIHRDGEPCELQLRDDAVMVQQQWEFNRLVIENQRAVIHAAAVQRNGTAVLLAGQSHSGKTTLAGWLAAHHGFAYLADEASAIDSVARVRPYVRPLGLRPDSPIAHPAQGMAERFMPEEVLVPASDLGARIADEPAAAHLLVFPRFDGERALRVTPVSQADALERLAHLTPGLVRHGREVFTRLGGVVLAAPAVEIRFPHVSEAAVIITEWVRRP